jgi:hypothetical protein
MKSDEDVVSVLSNLLIGAQLADQYSVMQNLYRHVRLGRIYTFLSVIMRIFELSSKLSGHRSDNLPVKQVGSATGGLNSGLAYWLTPRR